MPRLTRIVTGKGDDGCTDLNGERLSKDDLRVEAVGTVDELNSFIGGLLAEVNDNFIQTVLTQVQNDLLDLGGELHIPAHPAITAEKIQALETWLHQWNDTLPPLTEFVLPRGTKAAAACHIARAVCRRTERSVVRLHRETPLTNTQILIYLNRLSDLLFILARMLNRTGNQPEQLWDHTKK